MTLEELADFWDGEAAHSVAIADSTRSLDLHVREHAQAAQLRQCAMQLRLILGNARRNADAASGAKHPTGGGQ